MDLELRPRFHEGQYLGADDLSTIVDYERRSQARHALGAHTWGIAIGLQLTEKAAPGAPNRVEVTLQPGFAWDGFARPVANARPTRLNEALFAAIPYAPALDSPGGSGRLVEVWLAYDETQSRNPEPGFETCATDDDYARIGETFRFVIGQRPASQQRGRIRIGTNTLDAAAALSTFAPGAPPLYDTSVPHQSFPFDERPPLWLIPVGYVRWIARNQALGYFAARGLNPADNADARIRAFRRYVGAVAERIEAADGAIVLHHRGTDPEAPNGLADLLSSTANPASLLEDLVWVEGNLRVVGNARLAGGDLLFRHATGQDQGVPFYIARRGDDPPNPTTAQRDLRVVIGPTGDPKNRFIVGPEVPATPAPSIAPHFVVVSSGDVGIGRRDPETRLNVVGNKLRVQSATTTAAKRIDLRTDGTGVGLESSTDSVSIAGLGASPTRNRVLLNPGGTRPGEVGIRVASPKHDVDMKGHTLKLGVEEGNGGQLVVSPIAPNGIQLEARNTAGNGNAPELRVSGNAGASLPRLHVEAAQTRFEGNVAIGAPALGGRLIVASPVPGQGSVAFFTSTVGMQLNPGGNGIFVIQNGGALGWTALLQNRLGVGTPLPSVALHVAGDFLRVDGLGSGGFQEMAYLGGDGAARDVQLGSMNSAIQRVTVWNTATNSAMDLRVRNLVYNGLSPISDIALKEDITTIDDSLQMVAKLRGVRFKWKDPAFGEGPQVGVVAQEVESVVPEAVTRTREGMGVDYTKLVPILIGAVKELKDQVDDLRAEVKRLSASAEAAAPMPPRATSRARAAKAGA
jgi:hypothetical protein